MKTNTFILVGIFLWSLFSFTGCEAEPENGAELIPMPIGELAFTSLITRSGDDTDLDDYDNPYSDRNLKEVPDVVGVFVNKYPSGDPSSVNSIMENAIYRLSLYPSNNEDAENPGTYLYWYRTTHPAAYWDTSSKFDIYAYAPAMDTEDENDYYTISKEGVVAFNLEEGKGIPVDFIYASEKGKTRDDDAENLHLDFRHKLTKIVFKLKNSSGNAVTCYGMRYSVRYPKATFDLIKDEWEFLPDTDIVRIEKKAQYEIFSNEDVNLPELTTLLFPTDTHNKTGAAPTDVIVDFEIALNNTWYSVKDALAKLDLTYEENKLIVLTFNCQLRQGDVGDDGILWNVYQATFDSFEDGGSIGGTLE